MDITAKKMPPDEDGVRIAEFDERSYRHKLRDHRPLTDFWRIGPGYARKLEANRLYTMGDIAQCSRYNPRLLHDLFGVNAELVIDHAWGWEPCTIPDIRAYKPESSSLGSGQVLQQPYTCEKARLVPREMTELLVMDLVEKRLVTDQVVLTVGYDVDNLINPAIRAGYHGEVTTDRYGRRLPKQAHGTENLPSSTSSAKQIVEAVDEAARLTDAKIDLDESSLDLLNAKLQILWEHIEEEPEITVTYFVPDKAKTGGKYVTVSGKVRRIDDYERLIRFTDRTSVLMDDILSMEGEVFAVLMRREN